MVEFYTWTLAETALVTLLIALCVMTQTMAAVLSYYKRPRTQRRIFEGVRELFLLFHIIVLSLLMGQEHLGHNVGLIVPSGYVRLRILSVVCVVLLTGIIMGYRKNPSALLIIAASLLTLPVMETIFGNAYAWLYITALVFWLVRGIRICILRYGIIRVSISALSVKDAVDSLHTGILFSEPGGFIALVNSQMQRLMIATTGRVQRNNRYFYEQLMKGELLPGCEKTEYEGKIVCLLPDESAWVFTRREILIRNKQYIQLTATDITQRWALTAELRRQEEMLLVRGEELREMILGLQTLSQTRELQNAKLRAHDILGQRLTMLLHIVNSGQAPDYELFHERLQNLLDDLKSGQSAASPREKLENLRQTFQTINVDVCVEGELPEDDIKGYICVDILNESVVNAVRHGFATKVFVRITNVDDQWHLEITDNGSGSGSENESGNGSWNREEYGDGSGNGSGEGSGNGSGDGAGHPQPCPIREGGGISGMRSKVEPLGGSLAVTNHPRFMLKIKLPGGSVDV